MESGSYRLLIDQYESNLLTRIENAGKEEPLYTRLKQAFQDESKRPTLVYNMTEQVSSTQNICTCGNPAQQTSFQIREIGMSSENIALYSSYLALSAASRDNCNITVIQLKDLEYQ